VVALHGQWGGLKKGVSGQRGVSPLIIATAAAAGAVAGAVCLLFFHSLLCPAVAAATAVSVSFEVTIATALFRVATLVTPLLYPL
jgi:hypothetical protein